MQRGLFPRELKYFLQTFRIFLCLNMAKEITCQCTPGAWPRVAQISPRRPGQPNLTQTSQNKQNTQRFCEKESLYS